jgi:hypothetical protein
MDKSQQAEGDQDSREDCVARAGNAHPPPPLHGRDGTEQ